MIKRVGVIRNGPARYAERIMVGLSCELAKICSSADINLEIRDVVGEPSRYDASDNTQHLNRLLKLLSGPPDLIVSIGTQVSISAARDLKGVPLVFLGVASPEASGLINKEEWGERKRSICGIDYAPDVPRRMELISQLFPGKTAAFLLDKSYLQDEIFAKEIAQAARARQFESSFKIIDCTGLDSLPRLPRSAADCYFGFYYLNRRIRSIRERSSVALVGIDEIDLMEGAVASTGTNDYEIGARGAREIIWPSWSSGKHLGTRPIQKVPNFGQFMIHLGNCRRASLEITRAEALSIADVVLI